MSLNIVLEAEDLAKVIYSLRELIHASSGSSSYHWNQVISADSKHIGHAEKDAENAISYLKTLSKIDLTAAYKTAERLSRHPEHSPVKKMADDILSSWMEIPKQVKLNQVLTSTKNRDLPSNMLN